MPTYQYACTACGHRLEAVQSFTDAALSECPECAGRLRKVFSSVGIVFKGSGFYRTDSRSGSGVPSGGSEKKAESTTSDSAKSSGDSGSSQSSSTSSSTSGSTSSPASSSGAGSSTAAKAS